MATTRDDGLSRGDSRAMRDMGRQAMSQVVGVALRQAVSHDLLRTFAVVSKVNGDGTVDLECGSDETPMPLNGVRITLGCSTVSVGDTVVVDTYDHSPLVVAVLYSNASSGHTVASKPEVDKANESAASAKRAADSATESAASAKSKAEEAASDAASAATTSDAAKSAAAAAQGTANGAKSTADSLATLIRADSTGVTVGKSADGKTYSTGRTRMTDSAFQVLDKAGATVAQLASDGVSFLAGLVRIVAGKATLPGNLTVNSITIDSGGGVAVLRGIVSRISANLNGVTSSVSAGWEQDFGYGVTAIVRESAHLESGKMVPKRMASTHLASDKAELYVGDNSMKVTGDSFSLSHPEYLRKGLHITQGSKVCHGHGTPWVTLFESWSEFKSATGCYDSGTPTLVTMNGDWNAFDGTLSGCEIRGGYPVYVLAQTTGGLPNLSSSQALRINWICIW